MRNALVQGAWVGLGLYVAVLGVGLATARLMVGQ